MILQITYIHKHGTRLEYGYIFNGIKHYQINNPSIGEIIMLGAKLGSSEIHR